MSSIIKSQAKLGTDLLRNANYPGRGIIMGTTPSGCEAVQIYWTMGRSPSSRNRVLIKENGIVRTEPKDIAIETLKPELIIYNASAQIGTRHIVTNGRQTDTIAEYLKAGKTFEDALYTWGYETDPPILTSRISGLADAEGGEAVFKFNLIRATGRDPGQLTHINYTYRGMENGTGRCIHTYHLTRTCYPFEGEPFPVELEEDINANAERYWNSLGEDKRVGLYIKHINLSDGTYTDLIVQ